MDENKDQVQNEKPVNENPNDEVIETIEEVEIVEEPDGQDDGIRELARYGNGNLNANAEDSGQDEEDEDANEEMEAEVIETADPEAVANIDRQIQQLMKKYKMSMWALVACIVLYLVFLFLIKTTYSTWIVLGICVVMIGIAVYNTKISKQVQRLALEKRRLTNPKGAATTSSASAMTKSTAGAALGQVDESEPIVANAASLNDLPKQYTVLDDVEFSDGQRAQNVVVSPYGIAVVGNPDLRPEVDALLQEASIEDVPVFFYSPDEEVSALAEKIQMEKMVVLDENKIMEILLKLTGIKC